MKVLLLLDCNINTLGGAQNSVKTLARVLRKQGVKTGIFMPRARLKVKDESEKYFDYVFLRRMRGHHTRINHFIIEIISLKKCIKRFRPDIIHAQSARIAIMLGIMKKIRFIPKRSRILFTDRGYLPEYKKRIFIGLKMVVSIYDVIITTTERNKMEWTRCFRCNNVVCIPNVLDDDWFNHPKTDNMLGRKTITDGKIYIGFSGRYEEYKRWDTVIEICKYLKPYKNVHFVIAITADNTFRKGMENYIKLLRQNFTNDTMTIIKDASREQMMKFYDTIDIFVLTSRNESFGRTLIESMARETIAIGTNSGGVPEVVGDKNFLFNVGDAFGAFKIIKQFIDDPKRILVKKKRFLAFARKKYHEQIVAKRYMELYRRELNG